MHPSQGRWMKNFPVGQHGHWFNCYYFLYTLIINFVEADVHPLVGTRTRYPLLLLIEAGVCLLCWICHSLMLLVKAEVCLLGETQSTPLLLVVAGVCLLVGTRYPLTLLLEADVRPISWKRYPLLLLVEAVM